jgi:hypothetical protein
MDNKLENMFFQSIWEEMSRSSIKEFIVEKITNILPNLLLQKSTYLEESSVMSLRLLSSKSGLTL